MTENKSQAHYSVSYDSSSYGSACTTLQASGNQPIEIDTEGSSQHTVSMQEVTLVSSGCSQCKDEDSKDDKEHNNAKFSEISIKSQQEIAKNSNLFAIDHYDSEHGSSEQISQKDERMQLSTLRKLHSIYQLDQHLNKSKAKLVKVSEVLQESGDEALMEITFSVDKVSQSMSRIAKQLGSSSVLTRPKDQFPISKRTRKQMKIERKNQLNSSKQQASNSKLDTLNKQAANRYTKSKQKIKATIKSSHKIQNTPILTQTRNALPSISHSHKKSRGRPRSKSNGNNTPTPISTTIPNTQQTHQQIGSIHSHSGNNSLSHAPIQNGQSGKVRVVKIREIEKDSRNCLEYLLNFSDGSLRVVSAEQLVKLWPKQYGVYLIAKSMQSM